MSEIIVSSLKQQLEIAGVDTLHLSDKEAKTFLTLLGNRQASLTMYAVEKAAKNPQLLLLGLLTKQHIDAISALESQIESVTAMHDLFTDTVGENQSNKLNAESVIELSLITKLWLMVQGKLNMDFSLANDHASHTSQLLAKALRASPDDIRIELIASFYHGKNCSTPIPWPSKVLSWIKSVANG